jgi:hypothetical protein
MKSPKSSKICHIVALIVGMDKLKGRMFYSQDTSVKILGLGLKISQQFDTYKKCFHAKVTPVVFG